MIRVLSAVVLLPIVVGTIWYLPPIATLVLAGLVAGVAAFEYVRLAERIGARVPTSLVVLSAVVVCAATPGGGTVMTLTATMIAIGTAALIAGPPRPEVFRSVAAAVLPAIYIGVPLGLLATMRYGSREAVLLLLANVMVSDTAQYYGGRAFGRRLLAPAISPKKTVEGFISGMVAAAIAMAVLGTMVRPESGAVTWAVAGLTIAALGVAGDLFESVLKRAADTKDASGLIPGHGGMLDRIDSLLFAAPVFYVFVMYVA
jgi:phosphatidate cytidylyltransferase